MPRVLNPYESFPAGSVNSVTDSNGPFIDAVESIGSPKDAAATSHLGEPSAFELLKGIARLLGVPEESDDVAPGATRVVYAGPEKALGEMTDTAASAPSDNESAISLLKGLADALGV